MAGVETPCPSGVIALFFSGKQSTTEQTRSSFGGVQHFSGGCVLWYVCPPLYVLHPLHIMAEETWGENGGLNPSWLDFAFFLTPEVPKPFKTSVLEPLE